MKTLVRNPRGWIVAAGLALLALVPVLQRCGGGSGSGAAGAIVVSDQFVGTAAQTVLVSRVTAPADLWLVITSDDGGGGLGAELGHVALSQGVSVNVPVPLTTLAGDGDTLHAVLAGDATNPGVFEFPATDAPLLASDAMFAVDFGTVTISAVQYAQVSSQSVTASSVGVGQAGWLVIATDAGGNPGAQLGCVAVTAGTSANKTVVLSADQTHGTTLHALLATDSTGPGVCDFPTTDSLIAGSDATFTVDVPDASLSVTNVGATAYDWTAVNPPAAQAGLFPSGLGQNKEVTFTQGQRYEIVNGGGTAHPFELIGAADSVKLSQSGTGSLEADVTVEWAEVSATRLRFTASASLKAALTGYRCGVHTAAMRGNASIP